MRGGKRRRRPENGKASVYTAPAFDEMGTWGLRCGNRARAGQDPVRGQEGGESRGMEPDLFVSIQIQIPAFPLEGFPSPEEIIHTLGLTASRNGLELELLLP